MSADAQEVPQLELQAVIGFNGYVFSGLRVHPDREHLIYPLGCTVILKSLRDGQQEFLHGHTNNISCVTVSKSGRYIASGQVTFIGFKADVIIWDFPQRKIHARLQLHKVKVESLSFSPNDKYLASLGGEDDGSIVVWNIESKNAICGSLASPQSAGRCLAVQFSNKRDDIFVSAGDGNIRVWELDLANRKIRPSECQTGQLKRVVRCIEGVNTLSMLKTGEILVGSGDGLCTLCSGSNFKTLRKVQLKGGVTSITLRGEGHQFFVGTEAAQIYRCSYADFKEELIATSHNRAVNGVAFPLASSELFATCSQDDIRVWHSETSKELLRITVPNMTCNAVEFMNDGKSIISAWNDGKIRVFTPESGTLCGIIHNAHSMSVTAVVGTRDCQRIVSGGADGQVRLWQILPGSHRLVETMKEHKAAITCIEVKSDDKECVTAGSDGACIVWDLVRFVRYQMVLANTLFRAVCYHPEEYQIITSGTDRKITYWEVYDGSAIREIEGSQSGSINGVHISPDGRHFVTGGDEKLVKVWGYSEGAVTHVGVGHSGSITSICICPNNKFIVSTSADGAVLRWKYPHSS